MLETFLIFLFYKENILCTFLGGNQTTKVTFEKIKNWRKFQNIATQLRDF